jgi:hypothetical protein
VRSALLLAGVHESMARATDYLRFLKLYRRVRRSVCLTKRHTQSCNVVYMTCVLSCQLLPQDVRSGLKDCKVFQEVVHELTVQLQKKPPADDTIAARLLAVIVRFPYALVDLTNAMCTSLSWIRYTCFTEPGNWHSLL